MTLVPRLRAMAGSLARMAAGVVCAGVMLGAVLAALEPPPGPDPVQRFDLAVVVPPPIDAIPPDYEPISDRQAKVRPFGLIGRFVPSYLALLAAPTGSILGGEDSARPPLVPPASLPGPAPEAPSAAQQDPGAEPAAEMAPAARAPGQPAESPAEAPSQPVDIAAAPAEAATAAAAYDPAPAGPLHFLQGGYFAEQENAVALAEQLAAAGLPVRVEETQNSARKSRWLVLVGPYADAESLAAARDAALGLLADAFPLGRRAAQGQ